LLHASAKDKLLKSVHAIILAGGSSGNPLGQKRTLSTAPVAGMQLIDIA
jgi:hypothetical protein